MSLPSPFENLFNEADPLPWELPEVPNYEAFQKGAITLKCDTPPLIRGYFNGLQPSQTNWMLIKDKQCWMSCTPMELESQAPFLAVASGHVVVMGAGMGITIYNLLKNPEVTKVTVIENDPAVYDFLRSQSWDLWEGFMFKADTRLADALEVKDLGDVDYLYVDIWHTLGSEQAIEDVDNIQKNIQAKKVGYWGMELDFIHWCAEMHLQHPTMTHYTMWLRELEIPLIGEETPEMTMWCLRAAHNVVQY